MFYIPAASSFSVKMCETEAKPSNSPLHSVPSAGKEQLLLQLMLWPGCVWLCNPHWKSIHVNPVCGSKPRFPWNRACVFGKRKPLWRDCLESRTLSNKHSSLITEKDSIWGGLLRLHRGREGVAGPRLLPLQRGMYKTEDRFGFRLGPSELKG